MRTLRALAAIVLAAFALPMVAHGDEVGSRTIPLIFGYDLDGAAASTSAIFADADVVASSSYTITAQPDTCRALIATITDANASLISGTFTVTGTDGDGLRQTATFAATGGSGTRAIAGTWCSVTSVTLGASTVIDAGVDKVKIGTNGAAPFQYTVAWGPVRQPALGEVSAGVPVQNPNDAFQPAAVTSWREPSTAKLIKTSGTSATTAITSFTASSGSLTLISVGDLLSFQDASDNQIVAAVVAKADNNNATLDRAVLLTKAAGHGYQYRQRMVRSGIGSGWFTVAGWETTTVVIDVQQMTGTGGIDAVVECAPARSLASVATVASANIAAASAVEKKVSVYLGQAYEVCRVGLKWATNDDADAAAAQEERINVYAIQAR